MSKKVYEMQWDCQYCGTKKLLGKTHRFCPNCGASQNPDTRYFPSDEEKVAVEDHIYVGRDLICGACNDLNSASSDYCGQCGAPLAEAEEAAVFDPQTVDNPYESRDPVREKFDAEMKRVGGRKKKKNDKPRVNLRLIALVAFVFTVIAIGVFVLMQTENADFVVTGHEWSREIEVEKYDTRIVEGWHDSQVYTYLDNPTLQSCAEKQRGTKTVPYEECRIVPVDKGDGTYEEREICETKYRKVPNYEDWCTWRGQRWDYSYSASTYGYSLSETPHWREINLRCEGHRRIGCERERQRIEAYTVFYRSDENISYSCDFAQDVWETIPVESEWHGRIGRYNRRHIECDSLEPK